MVTYNTFVENNKPGCTHPLSMVSFLLPTPSPALFPNSPRFTSLQPQKCFQPLCYVWSENVFFFCSTEKINLEIQAAQAICSGVVCPCGFVVSAHMSIWTEVLVHTLTTQEAKASDHCCLLRMPREGL